MAKYGFTSGEPPFSLGYVVDFLMYYWKEEINAFKLAASYITCVASLLIYAFILKKRFKLQSIEPTLIYFPSNLLYHLSSQSDSKILKHHFQNQISLLYNLHFVGMTQWSFE